MQLISYVSQIFHDMPAVFDYLGANVPWLTVDGDALTVDNLTITSSATTALTFTDSVNGVSLTTPFVQNNNRTFQILITDTAVIVGQNNGTSAFLFGKSTDGTSEHYGLITRSAGSSNAETTLTYGALSTTGRGTRNVIESAYTTQFLPVYAIDTAYNIQDAFITIMSTYPNYYGKILLNGAKYVQCGGLALQYID